MRKENITIKGLGVMASYNKKIFPLLALQTIFFSISPYFYLWMSAEIVTRLYEGVGKQEIYTLVAITLLGGLFIHIMSALLEHVTNYQRKIWENNEAAAFNKKVLSLDYDKMESTEIRDHRRRVMENAYINRNGSGRLMRCVQQGMSQLVNIILSLLLFTEMLTTMILAGATLIGVGLIAALIVMVILNIVFNTRAQKKRGDYLNEVGELMLEENRLGQGDPNEHAGKDVRLYKQSDIFVEYSRKLAQKHFQVCSRTTKKIFKLEIPGLLISFGIQLSSFLIVCYYCVLQIFPIGSVIKYVGYLSGMIRSIEGVFQTLADAKINEPYLKLYLEFFEIKNEMYQGSLSVEKRSDKKFDIEFKNVSFKYPGSDTYALKNVNLDLRVGEKLAVVGMNGSGKTTFIKLLCRLYDPCEGEIIMNDFNVRKYDYRQYLDLFSVVFQDYKLLSMSLGNNVSTSGTWDAAKAEKYLHEVGFGERYENLPNKLDTAIYKDFDSEGVELSGGEAQKVALARALYKEAPFIILDEPTAALDPIAEAEIYAKFDEIVGDKTAIYISHRLSSCRFCDKIAVFDKGEIVQVGSHEELLKDEQGKYYELWNAQAQYYVKEKEPA